MRTIITTALLALTILGIVPSFAAAGVGSIDLGSISFPPGQDNKQLFEIWLNPSADTVTAVPKKVGAPEVFPYNGATGKGMKLLNGATLVPFQVSDEDSKTPSVTFYQYVNTRAYFTPRSVQTNGNVMQGNVLADGVLVRIHINQATGAVTANQLNVPGSPTIFSQVYPQSNFASFFAGEPFLYVVEPNAPRPGTFRIGKWMLWPNGIYSVGKTSL